MVMSNKPAENKHILYPIQSDESHTPEYTDVITINSDGVLFGHIDNI